MSFLKSKKGLALLSIGLILIVLIIDQILKIHIKTNFLVHKEVPLIGSWLKLHFIENEGMAFGWKFFKGPTGKIMLTLFRWAAAVLIALYIRKLILTNAHPGLILSISLIFAGAMGNIIDSTIYGMIFTESTMNKVAVLDPSNGYSAFLRGSVVDMFYFEAYWPKWFPGLGGKEIFPPIFNLADSSITTAVLIILVFQKRFFKKTEEAKALSRD